MNENRQKSTIKWLPSEKFDQNDDFYQTKKFNFKQLLPEYDKG
jgi:hypothetical protein